MLHIIKQVVFIIVTYVLIHSTMVYGNENTKNIRFKVEYNPEIGDLSGVNLADLCFVSHDTARYLTQLPDDHFAVHAGKVFNKNVTLQRVKDTLTFICNTYNEDKKNNRSPRLHNSEFVKAHFDFYRWYPDKERANQIAQKSTNSIKTKLLNSIPENKIFLTKYYSKLLKGSTVKTSHYDQALYSLPYDEQGLSLAQANKITTLTRHQFTRQQIISGILIKNKLASPLVWLTEEALHDVLLQGTGVFDIDGKRRYFNVHRNNGIAYDYAIGKREQARYWYFSEVPNIMGYGQRQQDKISLAPWVAFAGNVKELGLGKLFLITYDKKHQLASHLGVLADQGGAFSNNLFQLDQLAGSYYGWDDYYKANHQLPDYAKAWMLLVKH